MALALALARTAAEVDANNAYQKKGGKQFEMDRIRSLSSRCRHRSLLTLQNGRVANNFLWVAR